MKSKEIGVLHRLYVKPDVGLEGLVTEVTTQSTVMVTTENWAAVPYVGVKVPTNVCVPAYDGLSGDKVSVYVPSFHEIQLGKADAESLYKIEPEA